MPRGEATGDGPGCQQAQRRPPAGRVWDSCRPGTERQTGGGVGTGDASFQAWSPRSRCWGPLLRGVWGRSVPGHCQPRLCLCRHIAFPPVCLGPNAPHEDARTQASDLVSPRAALQWPICTQNPILASRGVCLPGSLEVTILVVDTARGGVGGGGAPGRNPGASRRKRCPDSGRAAEGQSALPSRE